MSRKDNLRAAFGLRPAEVDAATEAELSGDNRLSLPAPLSPDNSAEKRVRSGSIAAMGVALGDLKERAKAADRIEAGSAVVELDPSLIDGSFIADRVSDATDPTLSVLAESIRESGQQVPILVRPHPETVGRYQIAFGHRRVRAALSLERPVRAVIRPLTDAELVIAQGKENLERRDLSYIERAFFALHLEERGLSREVICAAMAADKAAISHYISVARLVPEDLVAVIGPAPRAGRPRWLALAERIKAAGAATLGRLLEDPSFHAKPSDDRFVAVLDALSPPSRTSKKTELVKDTEGLSFARVERRASGVRVTTDEKVEPGFGDFLAAQLPEILAAYRHSKG